MPCWIPPSHSTPGATQGPLPRPPRRLLPCLPRRLPGARLHPIGGGTDPPAAAAHLDPRVSGQGHTGLMPIRRGPRAGPWLSLPNLQDLNPCSTTLAASSPPLPSPPPLPATRSPASSIAMPRRLEESRRRLQSRHLPRSEIRRR